MGKRVDRIAAKMVDRIMARQPMITKSAGTRAQLTAAIWPAAVVVDELEKAVKRYGESMAQMNAQLEAITRQLSGFAGAGHPVPGVTQIAERGWRRFDAQDDIVGLVPKQAAAMRNGHSSPDVGVAPVPPPLWHPESEG